MSPGGAMVQRQLLIALFAALAVAMPAVADEEAGSPEPTPPECPAGGPCLEPPGNEFPTDTVACPLFDLTESPGRLVDPDGCWRNFVRRAIGVDGDPIRWVSQTSNHPWPF
mgnify:CR=1 FL=1